MFYGPRRMSKTHINQRGVASQVLPVWFPPRCSSSLALSCEHGYRIRGTKLFPRHWMSQVTESGCWGQFMSRWQLFQKHQHRQGMVGSHTQTLLCLLWTGAPSFPSHFHSDSGRGGRKRRQREKQKRERAGVSERTDREGKGEEIWFHLRMCFRWAWRCWTTTGALLLLYFEWVANWNLLKRFKMVWLQVERQWEHSRAQTLYQGTVWRLLETISKSIHWS